MLKKIISNTLSQVLSKVITAIISIFLLSILTNYLSVELFGVYSKIYNYLGIFAFLADLGLYTLMIREISEVSHSSSEVEQKDSKIANIVGNVLTLRVSLGMIIILLSLMIAYFIPGYNGVIELWGIFIVGLFTLVSLMNSTFLAYMQSQLQMEFSLISVVIGKVFNLFFIFLIIFVFLGKENFIELGGNGLLLILGSGFLGITINTFLNFLYANKYGKINFLFNYNYIKYIFKLSLPYGIALFLSVVYFKVDIIILSILEGRSSDVSIALYGLPMKIIEVLMVMGGFYLNSILPKLTVLFEKKEESSYSTELQSLLIVSFKILFGFGLSIFTFGVVFRNHIILIIANKEYITPLNHIYNSSQVFFIVLGILMFYSISLLYIYIFIAKKEQGILLKINIFITLFNIIGNWIVIPYYSFIGAGIITLISQILLCFITAYFSKKIIVFQIPFYFVMKVLFVSALFLIFLYNVLLYYSIGLYYDILIYGLFSFSLYSFFIYREIKR